MTKEPQVLEGKLVESIKVKELGKLAERYANIDIGLVLDEKTFNGIPVISNIAGVIKTGFNIRDRLYIKKIAYFLAQVGSTTQEQRDKFIKDNCQDVRKFEEAVLLILEQADNMEKSSLIGKIFKACILGKISYQDALSLSSIVNKALWQDLEALLSGNDTEQVKSRLANTGLLKTGSGFGRLLYTANSYTNILIEISKKE